MRKSIAKALADPTQSDAAKIKLLEGEVKLLEALVKAERDSREYLHSCLLRAVEAMDEETARRYEQSL